MNYKYWVCATCCLLVGFTPRLHARQVKMQPARVDFDAYEALVAAVKEHRRERLISFDRLLEMSKEKNVVLLDTRSTEMYLRKHIKGAVHLSFSDFTQENLAMLIPDPDTKIIIYCNNNISGDERNFATKSAKPALIRRDIKPVTLALNIPTYINLYGYGYRNVYELSELVPAQDNRIVFEGSEIQGDNLRQPMQYHK